MRTRAASRSGEREAWWQAREVEPPDAELVTHEIVWRPVFVIQVAIAPWEDPEDILAQSIRAVEGGEAN